MRTSSPFLIAIDKAAELDRQHQLDASRLASNPEEAYLATMRYLHGLNCLRINLIEPAVAARLRLDQVRLVYDIESFEGDDPFSNTVQDAYSILYNVIADCQDLIGVRDTDAMIGDAMEDIVNKKEKGE